MTVTTVILELVQVHVPPASPSQLDEIIVPVDGTPESERAVPIACDIARHLGASVRVMTTLSEVGNLSARAYVEGVVARAPRTVRVGTEVVIETDPTQAIVDMARSGGIGVCMATHARGRIVASMHPNIAEAVVAQGHGLVFLAGPSCLAPTRGTRIVFAHDGGDDATALGISLLPVLAALGDDLIVITVVPAPMGRATDDPYHEVTRAVAPLLDAARSWGIDAEHRLVFGADPRRAVLDATIEDEAALVVMVARHTNAVHRLREGSMTMAVVHESTVPVLVTARTNAW